MEVTIPHIGLVKMEKAKDNNGRQWARRRRIKKYLYIIIIIISF